MKRTHTTIKGLTKHLGPPTTVRLPSDLDAWVREEAEGHPDGKAGVIRDALSLLRGHKEQHEDQLKSKLLGAF